jgi:hypothetical protein
MGFAPTAPPRAGLTEGAGSMTEERFIGYFRLIDACDASGCPVCRCVVRESRSHLDALLYEQVTDPDTRRAIRASWGFCNWHTWMLREIEQSIFGSAIIYEDLVRLALKRTQHLSDRMARPARSGWLAALLGRRRARAPVDSYRQRAVCPACRNIADAETRYVGTLVGFINEGDLRAAYARSDGLCVPHLFAAVEGNEEVPGARVLVDETRAKWRRLGEELGSFIAKHDYRNREAYTEAEAASTTRAFEVLVGAQGVFGNDVHARTLEPEGATQRLLRESVP